MEYHSNPFAVSAPLYEIVRRMVIPSPAGRFDMKRALEGGSATQEEQEWERMHQQNPEAYLEVIQGDVSQAQYKLDRARQKREKGQVLQELEDDLSEMKAVLHKAIELHHELIVEATLLRNQDNKSESGLKLSHESLPNDTTPEFLLYTVYDWALDDHDIQVREWARPGALRPRRERKYTTRLLTIMDAAIEEHCEDVNSHDRFKKVAFEAWLKATFPDDQDILSQNVVSTMFTIIKPDT